jgi:UDP-N-acetylglucosamine 3-dehydrogenase
VNQVWKTVLVGAGRMGKNHLRVIEESPDFELVGIVDPLYNGKVPHWNDIAECIQHCDFEVAIVAVPTRIHYHTVEILLQNRKHVLVEKPLSPTYEEAKKLCELSIETGALLRVGHLERLNPAIRKLKEVLDSGILGQAIHLSFTRIGGYPNHVSENDSVLMDLAVHDIDVLLYLMGADPGFSVIGVASHSTWKPGLVDTSEILLRREGSVSASVHVNWVTPTKVRNLRVTCTRGVCFVDYILQTCVIHGGGLFHPLNEVATDFESLLNRYRNSDRIEFGVDREEPLKVQLREFYFALAGKPSKVCTALEAAATVKIAEFALLKNSSESAGQMAA